MFATRPLGELLKKIPHDAPVISKLTAENFLLCSICNPTVLYSSVFVVALVVSYPGYCATIFKSLITAQVVFTTYNTAYSPIAYPPSAVEFLILPGTFEALMLLYPIKVALLPIILMFLSA